MLHKRSLLPIAGLLFAMLSGASAQQTFPFQNPALPTQQRVDDLVARMTLEEKAAQMGVDAPAITRLGIPAYYWWSESLHGDRVSPATVFPAPIGLAATFDLDLHGQVADAIADEDRAWYNRTGGAGKPQPFHGLTFFAPNINIFRDPRWGRGQETYGEDPYLTARFGVAYVNGLQGSDPKYLKVIATSKHFAVHSGPEPERHTFNAVVSPYDLNDTYLPAFEATVRQGRVQSVMGAYNSLYGVPDNASVFLLQQTLRQKWGFGGYVVSDCGAINDIYIHHHYTASLESAAAAAVKSGCDLSCGTEYGALPGAVKHGLISEADLDRSVKRLFTARMQLGMFDPPAQVPYAQIPATVIDSPEHRRIALRAARESIVLLKNSSVLPISQAVRTLAVIGPNADAARVQRSNYSGASSHEVSALDGIRSRAARSGIRVEYAQGVSLVPPAVELTPIPASRLDAFGAPGLRGEYFANEDLQGAPTGTRQDAQINFNWAPIPPPGLPLTHYSVRWTGQLTAPADGSYVLGVRGDDGYRLFIDGHKVIDVWQVQSPKTQTYAVHLRQGQKLSLRLEYFQAEGGAEVHLLWNVPGSTSPVEALAAAKRADALAVARRADAMVFVGGISSQIEGEEGTNGNGDRADLDLPSGQQELLQTLVATGKPVILVLMNGSALSVNWAQAHVSAILESWYSGEEGGTAIADVLFGDYNPAGRLPLTFYTGTEQLPPFRDYAMKSRTYRYFDGKPLYPFGYGLSYTQFRYSALKMPLRVNAGQEVTVSAEVENIGSRAGDEVAELYLRPTPDASVREIGPGQPMPRFILAGFARVPLKEHERRTVTFTLLPSQLQLVNTKGEKTLQPGSWQVYVGGSLPGLGRQTSGVSQRLSVAVRN